MSVNPNIPPPSGFGPLLMEWLVANTMLNKSRINAITANWTGGGGGGGLTNPLLETLDMGGFRIVNLTMSSTPGPLDALNLAYAQAFIAGLSWKGAVRLATATGANILNTYANGASGVGATITTTSLAALSIDGVPVVLNDRVLIKDQLIQFQNGIYIVTQVGTGVIPNILTRTIDADLDGELVSATCSVSAGATNASTVYTQTTAAPITVGTSLLVFQKTFDTIFSAGMGIDITGNVITNELSTGVAGGQSVIGGTGAADNLTLRATSASASGVTLGPTGTLTLVNSANIVVGTGAGTQIATSAAQKLGFYGTAPVIQQSGNVLTALAAYGFGALTLPSGTGTVSSVTSPLASINVALGTTTPQIDINLANANAFTALQSFTTGVSTAWTPTTPNTSKPVSTATLSNTAVATALQSQYSGSLIFQGSGWKSNATAAAQNVEFRIFCIPTQGTVNPSGKLYIMPEVNGSVNTAIGGTPVAGTFFDSKGNISVNQHHFGQPPNNVGNGNTSIVIGVGAGTGIIANSTSGNIIIGQGSGAAIVVGVDNTLLGTQAATSLTGSNNTCIGRGAGNAMTSGTNNIILGTSAITTITTGQFNVAIGNYTIGAVGTTANRTGNSGVFISDGAGILRILVAQTTGNILLGNNNITDDGNNLLQVPGSIQSTGVVSAISTNAAVKVANYTLTKNDFTILADPTGGAITLTLPTAGITVGQIFTLKRFSAAGNALTVIVSGGVILIDGAASYLLPVQYDKVMVQWNGTQYFII